jgi:hypothetical protein
MTKYLSQAEYIKGADFEAFAGSVHVDHQGCWIMPRPYHETNENCLSLKISTFAGNQDSLKPVLVHLYGTGRANIPDQHLGNLSTNNLF